MSRNRNSKTEATRRSYATLFAAALGQQLEPKGIRQADLARLTGRSPSYVNHTIAGRKAVSAEWVNVVAHAIECSDKERRKLHRAAALDAGFDIDK